MDYKSQNQNNPLTKVKILLAYKDGEAFIEDQLKSIASQIHQHFHIELYDDCSDTPFDETLLKKSGLRSNQISITTNVQNLGYCQNFLSGLKNSSDAWNLFSFCDQDDIWYKDKIKRAVDAIGQYPDNTPCLYCSRTETVDHTGRQHLGYSPLFTKKPSFTNALMQNIGGGNTMVLNKAARQLLVEASKGVNVVSHDWWAYIVVSGVGGVVIYDPTPSLKYRQHDHNLIGKNSGWRARFIRARMLLQGHYRGWNQRHVAALKKKKHLLSNENKRVLELFIEARQGQLFRRIYLFIKGGFHRQTFLGNLGLFVSVILKKV